MPVLDCTHSTTHLRQVAATCTHVTSCMSKHSTCFLCCTSPTGVSSPTGGRTGSGGGRNPGAVTQTDNLLVATHSKALQVGSVVIWTASGLSSECVCLQDSMNQT
jgi:hypothetical protein